MGSGHSHAHGSADELDHLVDPRVRRNLWMAVWGFALVIVIGAIVLWPSGSGDRQDPLGLGGEPVGASVDSVAEVPCSFDPLLACKLVEVAIAEGEFRGERLQIEQPLESTIESGDEILVDLVELGDGTIQAVFYDFERGTPMLLLVIVFVTAIVVLGRWRGVGALAGLVMSFVILIGFALPALLDGSNAVAVAIVTAGAIAFVALFLAHGTGLATATALLSTSASLAITAALAAVFLGISNFTGFGDENVGFLDALGTQIDPRGLLLAGIVIGSLGVLDDVTVTQVSAVWELKRAAPESNFSELYGRALRIGRDHISSTVNTLFLAYAGASLPLLLLFSEADQGLASVATREIVAVEIVRALVGSVGLVASVPISTALAAKVLSSTTMPPPHSETPLADGDHPPSDPVISDDRSSS
ncbi:MAG TPA: YibE/F family protein [Ilumatobacteraceae bacterium]|nr:YibE/F family protein [Ilumatobacteraceae bacterium]